MFKISWFLAVVVVGMIHRVQVIIKFLLSTLLSSMPVLAVSPTSAVRRSPNTVRVCATQAASPASGSTSQNQSSRWRRGFSAVTWHGSEPCSCLLVRPRNRPENWLLADGKSQRRPASRSSGRTCFFVIGSPWSRNYSISDVDYSGLSEGAFSELAWLSRRHNVKRYFHNTCPPGLIVWKVSFS